jgi:pimeloyl-ACP methyl ester carboxylesterase
MLSRQAQMIQIALAGTTITTRSERHPQQLAATIPGAEYTELATGHLAALEQPDAFASVIEAFLMRER